VAAVPVREVAAGYREEHQACMMEKLGREKVCLLHEGRNDHRSLPAIEGLTGTRQQDKASRKRSVNDASLGRSWLAGSGSREEPGALALGSFATCNFQLGSGHWWMVDGRWYARALIDCKIRLISTPYSVHVG